MAQENEKPPTETQKNSVKPWFGKAVLAVLTAFGMAFVGYFTGLLPQFLDPIFGGTPSHEIAVEVTDAKSGRGIDGALVVISELGKSANETALLDSKTLIDGDTKLVAETASKSARIKIEYEATGKVYRYRKVLTFADSAMVSLVFPDDFNYDGKDQSPKPGKPKLPFKVVEGLQINPGSTENISDKKTSIDSAFGEAALGLDDVTRQMREAREAREAAAKQGQQ